MLIVIPSYKRTDCLKWVLRSVARCDVSRIAEKKRVLVVNNHPPSRPAIDQLISEFAGDPVFSFQARHREETIPATDNWFSAVREFAVENEVVIFLGDDDLMLPWGIQDRYLEITRSKADMLLSDFADRIFFYESATRYWLTGPLPEAARQEKSARSWGFFPARHPEASFLSNHCYRNTPGFRSALRLAFDWCDSQTWLDKHVRTCMFLFYLPYAITQVGGVVVSLHSKCVLRGATADEAIEGAYQDGGNPAFYGLCAYDIFSNRALPCYTETMRPVCARFRGDISRGLLSMLVDRKIKLSVLLTTMRHAGFRLPDLSAWDVLSGLVPIAFKALGLRGARLRWMRYSRSLGSTERLFP